MTIDEYWNAVLGTYNENPSLRWGQACFNVLNQYRRDLADMVCATRMDPFYARATDDERYIRFVNYIQENW
jgi:hypothetical protein